MSGDEATISDFGLRNVDALELEIYCLNNSDCSLDTHHFVH